MAVVVAEMVVVEMVVAEIVVVEIVVVVAEMAVVVAEMYVIEAMRTLNTDYMYLGGATAAGNNIMGLAQQYSYCPHPPPPSRSAGAYSGSMRVAGTVWGRSIGKKGGEGG
jgi:hypothetical protein